MKLFKNILIILIIINFAIFCFIQLYKSRIIVKTPYFATKLNDIIQNIPDNSIFNTNLKDITYFNGKSVIFNIYDINNIDYLNNFNVIEQVENNNLNVNIIDIIVNNNDEIQNINETDNVLNFIKKHSINRPVYLVNRDVLKNTLNLTEQNIIITDFNINNFYILYQHNINYKNIVSKLNEIYKKTLFVQKYNNNQYTYTNNNDELFIKSLDNITIINNYYNNMPVFAITDTFGKQIFIININGDLIDIIGNGNKNIGETKNLNFCSPKATKYINNKLFVVDSCDNSIKEIDLKEKNSKYLIKSQISLKNIFDFEILNKNEIIFSSSNGVFVYDMNKKESLLINSNLHNIYKIVKYNGIIYLFDSQNLILYSYNNDGHLEAKIDIKSIIRKNSINIKYFFINSMGFYFADTENKTIWLITHKNQLEKKEFKNVNNLKDLMIFRNYLYVCDDNNIKQLDLINGHEKNIYINFSEESARKLMYKYNFNKSLTDKIFKSIELKGKNLNVRVIDDNHKIVKNAPNSIDLYIKENNSLRLINRQNLKHKSFSFENLDNLQNYYIIGKIFYKNAENKTYIKHLYYNIIFLENTNNNELIIDIKE